MLTQSELLKKKIAEQQKKLEELQKQELLDQRNSAVKLLEEYTIDEKVKAFDKLYKSALSELNEKENGDYCEDNDNAQYTWEDVMSLLAKDRTLFWKYFNSL